MPGLVATEWRRFTQPWADVPPYSPLRFIVTPGDMQVLYGGELEIGARVEAARPIVELVLAGATGGRGRAADVHRVGRPWRAVLAKLTEPADVLRPRLSRPQRQAIASTLITVPQLENVRVEVVPPAYAGQPAYEGPVPADGVKGLRGTKVTLWATSNRPLVRRNVAVASASRRANGPRAGACGRCTEPGGRKCVGQFEIRGDGKFECRVIDAAGRRRSNRSPPP